MTICQQPVDALSYAKAKESFRPPLVYPRNAMIESNLTGGEFNGWAIVQSKFEHSSNPRSRTRLPLLASPAPRYSTNASLQLFETFCKDALAMLSFWSRAKSSQSSNRVGHSSLRYHRLSIKWSIWDSVLTQNTQKSCKQSHPAHRLVWRKQHNCSGMICISNIYVRYTYI